MKLRCLISVFCGIGLLGITSNDGVIWRYMTLICLTTSVPLPSNGYSYLYYIGKYDNITFIPHLVKTA